MKTHKIHLKKNNQKLACGRTTYLNRTTSTVLIKEVTCKQCLKQIELGNVNIFTPCPDGCTREEAEERLQEMLQRET